ncbi:dephospho-CoA kinase [Mariprofundus micogutta]|uniref:Dephospho-CoA kinase n=1 Tax=Mariprofundus micogutta TaxID=1921010 RepID=A0A1L8CPP4_9PROT|nr:dephospho-CoA kinase [Mariprofundus micogutta]GAV20867.1 dephospho-CoA kinase [Mariprofundus micogutta]
MSKLQRIGLTGGIGSGKSTAASMFAEQGIPVLDLDQVGRDLLAPGSAAVQQIQDAFGITFVLADGPTDRKALAAHCFADAAKTARLNAIMHPLIWQAEEQWLDRQQGEMAIIEASVLLESGGAGRMDAVIVVMAEERLRLQRVLRRGLQDEHQFHVILKRQCDDQQRVEQADYLINNNGSLSALRDQVVSLYEKLQRNS